MIKNRKRLLPGLIAIILLAEIVVSSSVYLLSRAAAMRMPTVVHTPSTSQISGITLYESGRDAVVDLQLLELLSQMHSRNENAVRLPADFAGYMRENKLDGGWLGRIATLMEMIFQSGHHLILTDAFMEGAACTAEQYAEIWHQVDSAFGLRPARELWYEWHIPADADFTEWTQTLQELAADIRSTNSEREILLLLDSTLDDAQWEQMISLALEIDANLGICMDQALAPETLSMLYLEFADSDNTLVLIGAENTGDDDELNGWIMDTAARDNVSYLI